MPVRTIRDIIRSQRPVTVAPSASVRTAARLMRDQGVGALLVVDNGRLTGIFTERDALFRVLAEGGDPETTAVERVMTADPMTITADRPLGHALHAMHEGNFRHLPVMEGGVPVGVVSIRDAIGAEIARFEKEIDDKEALFEVLAF
jgi:CBS domain-containing protein